MLDDSVPSRLLQQVSHINSFSSLIIMVTQMIDVIVYNLCLKGSAMVYRSKPTRYCTSKIDINIMHELQVHLLFEANI